MLRLSQPFAKPLSPKLMKIQPSYTAVVVADEDEANSMGVHAKGRYNLGNKINRPHEAKVTLVYRLEMSLKVVRLLHLQVHSSHAQ